MVKSRNGGTLPVIPELGRCRQEDQEFKVIFVSTGSFRPAGLHNTLSPDTTGKTLGTIWEDSPHKLCLGTVIENSGASF
ncbi:hypothetical protein I79_021689 [Cricetulus griseus]|uniref:Uncharacterized protein n=1 Tax=Cricetulus griseus TaxID=10029 RepID=G3IDB3_CRIGR|nr:hypothetical protein I79_021689 [Cricetulus griseus]